MTARVNFPHMEGTFNIRSLYGSMQFYSMAVSSPFLVRICMAGTLKMSNFKILNSYSTSDFLSAFIKPLHSQYKYFDNFPVHPIKPNLISSLFLTDFDKQMHGPGLVSIYASVSNEKRILNDTDPLQQEMDKRIC
jgi:hypothetical protein